MDDILDIENSYNSRISNDALKALAKKEEPRFLSILLKDKDCLMDAISFGIKPGNEGHFWIEENRFLFNIIYQYYQKHSQTLTRTAMESIMDSIQKIGRRKIDDDDRTTARMYYDEIYHMEAPIEDYELLRDHINNRYVQWQAFEIMKNNMEKLVKTTNNQDELIKDLQTEFQHIDNVESDAYCGNLNMLEAMPKVRDYITNRRENPEENPRIPTFINAIDRVYYFNPGSYTIISGMINGGKTTLMFNMAMNMARAGYNVVFVSIEKEAFPMMLRLTALHALVDYNRIKEGGKGDYGLSDVYYEKLIAATKDLEENIKPNFDCIQAVHETKLSKLISEIDKIKARKKIDVLFVDYLGVIGFETHHPGRPDLDEAIVSKRLQAYGKLNHFVTFAASQLKTPSSKEIRNKSKKATADDPSQIEVNTEDLAGSKMIIADADNGLSIILNNDKPATKAFIYGTKARDDEAHKCVVLDFDGRLGRISDPEFDSGHIKEVDNLLYDDQIADGDLTADDGLFDDLSGDTSAIEELNDDAFSFIEDGEDEPKSDNITEAPKELIDDEIFQID